MENKNTQFIYDNIQTPEFRNLQINDYNFLNRKFKIAEKINLSLFKYLIDKFSHLQKAVLINNEIVAFIIGSPIASHLIHENKAQYLYENTENIIKLSVKNNFKKIDYSMFIIDFKINDDYQDLNLDNKLIDNLIHLNLANKLTELVYCFKLSEEESEELTLNNNNIHCIDNLQKFTDSNFSVQFLVYDQNDKNLDLIVLSKNIPTRVTKNNLLFSDYEKHKEENNTQEYKVRVLMSKIPNAYKWVVVNNHLQNIFSNKFSQEEFVIIPNEFLDFNYHLDETSKINTLADYYENLIEFFVFQAKTKKINIVCGNLWQRKNNYLHHKSVFINSSGELNSQTRLHLKFSEIAKLDIRAGNYIRSYSLKDSKFDLNIGMLMQEDIFFPELTRRFYDQETDVIFALASATNSLEYKKFLIAVQARVLESHMPIIFCCNLNFSEYDFNQVDCRLLTEENVNLKIKNPISKTASPQENQYKFKLFSIDEHLIEDRNLINLSHRDDLYQTLWNPPISFND